MSNISHLPAPLRDALALLKLDWPTTAELLGEAFRKVSLVAHPDRGGSTEQMQRVNKAHEVVKHALAGSPAGRSGNPWRDGRGNESGGVPWDDLERWWRRRQEQRGQANYPPPEPHEYDPPKNARESFERNRDAGKRSEFCNLRHWQKSRLKPENLTRQLGSFRCTIYYKDGQYGWVVAEVNSSGGRVSTFSTHRYDTRAEAVANLADVLELPYEDTESG